MIWYHFCGLKPIMEIVHQLHPMISFQLKKKIQRGTNSHSILYLHEDHKPIRNVFNVSCVRVEPSNEYRAIT